MLLVGVNMYDCCWWQAVLMITLLSQGSICQCCVNPSMAGAM